MVNSNVHYSFFSYVIVLKYSWVNQNWSDGLIYCGIILLCLLDNYAISQMSAVCLFSWRWTETASLSLARSLPLFCLSHPLSPLFICLSPSLSLPPPFSLSLSHSLALLSLVLFVVSSPGLVLNVDVRDELLGYVADVRRAAVSCLQLHLEISFLQPRCPPLLFLSLFLRVPA